MDDQKKAKFARELERLRIEYVRNLDDRVGIIGEAMDQVAHGAGGVTPGLETIRFEAHKTAGSGAMFGFAEITDVAREIELLAAAQLASARKPSPADRAVLAGLVDRLKILALQARAATVPAAEVETVDSLDAAEPPRERHILLIEPDRAFAEDLVVGMANFGFSVRRVAHADAAAGAAAKRKPSAMLVSLATGDSTTLGTLAPLRGQTGPLIVISENRGLEARLAAVRAGADAYLFKPIAVGEVVDALDRLTATEDMEPYRVMILDDDPQLAGYVDVVLRGAGMITSVGSNPMAAMRQVEEFAPELILLDLNMPECSGEELAAVIRQQENLAGVSIVFLSGESDPIRRLAALRRGADDFLSKPIRADDLIAAVRTRVQRFRLLRNLMVRDSMTGLFNHSTFWSTMENEVARARRSREPLSLAVLDIDHFKRVNDAHGHAVGDVVIQSLARLLRRVVRQTDHVGRLGGEEFGIILVGSKDAGAATICDRVRASFAELRHASEQGEFSATLSCGIAAFPECSTASELFNVADEALYAAKEGGRNRVVVAGK